MVTLFHSNYIPNNNHTLGYLNPKLILHLPQCYVIAYIYICSNISLPSAIALILSTHTLVLFKFDIAGKSPSGKIVITSHGVLLCYLNSTVLIFNVKLVLKPLAYLEAYVYCLFGIFVFEACEVHTGATFCQRVI